MKSQLMIGLAAAIAALFLSADDRNIARADSVELAYVYSTIQFPETRATNVRHTFRLRIPANSVPLTSVRITVPAGLTVKNDLNIEDQSGNKIPATIIADDRNITIEFPQPVAAGTDLNIDLNHVNLWGTARNYQVSIRSDRLDRSLGTVQFRNY
jgi:Protein of unknown function (DUF2808)